MTLWTALGDSPKTVQEIVAISGWSLRNVLVGLRDALARGDVIEVPGPRYVLDHRWTGQDPHD